MAVNPTYKLVATTKDISGELTKLVANQPDFLVIDAIVPAILTSFLTAFATYTDMLATNLISVTSNGARRVNGGLQYGIGQRETKWVFFFTDNVTGAPYDVAVPLAKSGGSVSPGTDFLPSTLWAGNAIETTAEALFYSPDGNLGTLVAIKFEGRNN